MDYTIKYYNRVHENGEPYIWAEIWDHTSFLRGLPGINEGECRSLLEQWVKENKSPYKEEEIIISI